MHDSNNELLKSIMREDQLKFSVKRQAIDEVSRLNYFTFTSSRNIISKNIKQVLSFIQKSAQDLFINLMRTVLFDIKISSK